MREPPPSFTPLAIVGLACRLPGANNLDEYWELIRSGGDATGELPLDLIDRELYFDPRKGVRGKSYTTKGGLIDDLPFDNSKCRLREEWVKNFDPAHRVICEVASDALRDAGYDPFDLATREAGVYLGHTGGTNKPGDIVYAIHIEQALRYLHDLESIGHLTAEERQAIADRITSEVRAECDHRNENPDLIFESNVGAQIVASAFGLEGPCMVIDAACASSMQALAMAGRALQQGNIDMALVGGASNCKRESLILFSAAQSVSADRSRPFDAEASGLITSEGYVLLVVKTLEKALADGDEIRCVIRGIGMSADGKGKSLWAPLKDGQKLAVERAYRGNAFSLEEVQYVEAHATSTQVGDATEIAALAETFPPRKPGQRPIPLGSVKANIGHTLETAGLAGLLKAVLAMQRGTIPPCANLETPNPAIDWQNLPFYLPMQPEPWNPPAPGEPRNAAVNAFGIGGLNVHVVLEQFVRTKPLEYYLPTRNTAIDRERAHEPIAIIGIGNILPGAQTPEEYWNLLESGEDPKVDAPADRWDASYFCQPGEPRPYRAYACRGGFITGYQYDWRAHKVPPKQVANANPLQFALLDAVDRALDDAGYSPDKLDRDRVGVVVGTTFGGEFASQLQIGLRLPDIDRRLKHEFAKLGMTDDQMDRVIQEYEARVLKAMPALIDETGSFTSSTLSSRITKTFNLRGGALALDGGMGTGLAALSVCVDTLRSGDCDMMLCAAGERSMDLTVFESLSRSKMLADDTHPDFDESTGGIVPGEGCGVLVLKRLSDAERDGDKVIAVVRGIGAGADWEDSGAALRQAIERSLRNSELRPPRPVCDGRCGGVARTGTDHTQRAQRPFWGGPRRHTPLRILARFTVRVHGREPLDGGDHQGRPCLAEGQAARVYPSGASAGRAIQCPGPTRPADPTHRPLRRNRRGCALRIGDRRCLSRRFRHGGQAPCPADTGREDHRGPRPGACRSFRCHDRPDRLRRLGNHEAAADDEPCGRAVPSGPPLQRERSGKAGNRLPKPQRVRREGPPGPVTLGHVAACCSEPVGTGRRLLRRAQARRCDGVLVPRPRLAVPRHV